MYTVASAGVQYVTVVAIGANISILSVILQNNIAMQASIGAF